MFCMCSGKKSNPNPELLGHHQEVRFSLPPTLTRFSCLNSLQIHSWRSDDVVSCVIEIMKNIIVDLEHVAKCVC